MIRTLALLLALCPLAFCSPALAQDQDRDDAQEQESTTTAQEQDDAEENAHPESVVTEAHRTVWRWEAMAALSKFDFEEKQEQAVTDAYIEARAAHTDSQDYYRDEARDERARQLQQSRRTGEVGADYFDQSELQRDLDADTNHKMQRFARRLVAILKREKAEEVFPYLGAFDPEYDALVKAIVDFELEEDEATLAAIVGVLDYQIALSDAFHSSMHPREEGGFDRAGYSRKRIEARDALLRLLDAQLDDAQLERIARMLGMRPARDRDDSQ